MRTPASCLLLTLLMVPLAAAGGAVEVQDDAEGDVAVSVFGNAKGRTLAVSGFGDADGRAVVLSGAGNTTACPTHPDFVWWGCHVSASVLGDAEGGTITVSGTGDARHCPHGAPGCGVVVSGTGNATGSVAVSPLGEARGCTAEAPWCAEIDQTPTIPAPKDEVCVIPHIAGAAAGACRYQEERTYGECRARMEETVVGANALALVGGGVSERRQEYACGSDVGEPHRETFVGTGGVVWTSLTYREQGLDRGFYILVEMDVPSPISRRFIMRSAWETQDSNCATSVDMLVPYVPIPVAPRAACILPPPSLPLLP